MQHFSMCYMWILNVCACVNDCRDIIRTWNLQGVSIYQHEKNSQGGGSRSMIIIYLTLPAPFCMVSFVYYI